MSSFLVWVAKSPVASALKVALGAGLVYFIDNISDFNLSPIVAVVVTAGIPVLINALNVEDARYGRKTKSSRM